MNDKRGNARRQGFTLIELLIVVAIIAILAAIAVPNFLEAQTRAKIARVKADQRTIATAIETYAIDWNRPVAGHKEAWASIPSYWVSGKTSADEFDEVGIASLWARYTSPVAYLTSIPMDPFLDKGRLNVKGTWVAIYDTPFFAYETAPVSGKGTGAGAPFVFFSPQGGNMSKAVAGNSVSWWLFSLGPYRSRVPSIKTREPGGLFGDWMAFAGVHGDLPSAFYDASNGTVSFGRIARSNKGVAPEGLSPRFATQLEVFNP